MKRLEKYPVVRLEKAAEDVFKSLTQFHVLMQPSTLTKVSGWCSPPSVSHLEHIIIMTTTNLGLLTYFAKFLPCYTPFDTIPQILCGRVLLFPFCALRPKVWLTD